MARAAHRIAQVKAWASCRRQYVLKLGDAALPFECLTAEAFQDLRDRIASDWWWERKQNRRNRALYARASMPLAAE